MASKKDKKSLLESQYTEFKYYDNLAYFAATLTIYSGLLFIGLYILGIFQLLIAVPRIIVLVIKLFLSLFMLLSGTALIIFNQISRKCAKEAKLHNLFSFSIQNLVGIRRSMGNLLYKEERERISSEIQSLRRTFLLFKLRDVEDEHRLIRMRMGDINNIITALGTTFILTEKTRLDETFTHLMTLAKCFQDTRYENLRSAIDSFWETTIHIYDYQLMVESPNEKKSNKRLRKILDLFKRVSDLKLMSTTILPSAVSFIILLLILGFLVFLFMGRYSEAEKVGSLIMEIIPW